MLRYVRTLRRTFSKLLKEKFSWYIKSFLLQVINHIHFHDLNTSTSNMIKDFWHFWQLEMKVPFDNIKIDVNVNFFNVTN